MLILRDNKLINIDISEDKTNTSIIARKSLETLITEHHKRFNGKYKHNFIDEQEYTLSYSRDDKEYIFRCTKSEYGDKSSLGYGHGIYRTKGEAIQDMLNDGFTVFNGDIQITN